MSSEAIEEALGALGLGVIPRLLPFLDAGRDESGEVANGPAPIAARVLARFGTRAVPALERALLRPAARMAAADAIRDIGPDAARAVSALVTAFEGADSDQWDQGAILGALFAMGDRACAARPLLQQVFTNERDPTSPVQSDLVQSLEAALKKLADCPTKP